MEQEVVVSSNDSSIYDVLSSSLQNCLLYLSKIDRETYGMTACAVLTIIGASTYIFYRVKGSLSRDFISSRVYFN